METKTESCNLTKYIKRGPDRWQHCPVVRGKTGRLKQDLVLVEGRIEHHPEGYYSLDWREGGRRHRMSWGKDAPAAQLALERHVATKRARAIGIAVAEGPCAASPGVEEACAEYLDETRLQRSPKTFKQYRTALAYFQENCGRRRLDQVDRRTLLDFRQFLADVKKLSPRTICTKMMVVEQMLKTNGRSRLLRRGDWPRYVERIPQAYSPEQLKLFFAACRPDDFLLFVLPGIRLPGEGSAVPHVAGHKPRGSAGESDGQACMRLLPQDLGGAGGAPSHSSCRKPPCPTGVGRS